MPLFGMKMTGSGSRIAAFNSPLTSAGVDGRATLRPGLCSMCASMLQLCSAPEPAEDAGAGDHGHGQLVRVPAVHEPPLGELVEDLVARDEQEVGEGDVDDRDGAADGGAAGGADHERLDDAGVAHPGLAELVDQASRETELAAETGEVLAHREDALVA